jgi:F-type H+-transporting ATPase subunit a
MIYTNNLRDIASPLDQFEIRNLLSIEAPILGDMNISITNIGLYLLISVFIVLTTSVLATNYNKIISNS